MKFLENIFNKPVILLKYMHKNFDKYNKPKEGPVIEKIKQGQTFVISGKTEWVG